VLGHRCVVAKIWFDEAKKSFGRQKRLMCASGFAPCRLGNGGLRPDLVWAEPKTCFVAHTRHFQSTSSVETHSSLLDLSASPCCLMVSLSISANHLLFVPSRFLSPVLLPPRARAAQHSEIGSVSAKKKQKNVSAQIHEKDWSAMPGPCKIG